jgi:hypothetical protein
LSGVSNRPNQGPGSQKSPLFLVPNSTQHQKTSVFSYEEVIKYLRYSMFPPHWDINVSLASAPARTAQAISKAAKAELRSYPGVGRYHWGWKGDAGHCFWSLPCVITFQALNQVLIRLMIGWLLNNWFTHHPLYCPVYCTWQPPQTQCWLWVGFDHYIFVSWISVSTTLDMGYISISQISAKLLGNGQNTTKYRLKNRLSANKNISVADILVQIYWYNQH